MILGVRNLPFLAGTQPTSSGGGGGGTLPTTNLRAWWKVDTLSLANGDLVTSWQDSSGNGHTLTASGPSFSLGGLRNDFGDFVGTRVTVGASNIQVTHLGRYIVSGNTQTHTVKLVAAATGIDVPGGSVSVDTTLFSPGAIGYVALAAPITLTAGQTYYLVSLENIGGDQWHDTSTYGSINSAVSIPGAVYRSGGVYNNIGSTNQSYVPVDMRFDTNGTINVGTEPTYNTGIVNGLAGLRMNLGKLLAVPSGVLTGITEGEFFMALKIDNQPGVTDGTTGWGQFPFSTDFDTYVWTDGQIYSGVLTTVRRNFTPSTTLTSYHLYNVISTPSEWTCNLNGVQRFTTATNTVKNSGGILNFGFSGGGFYLKGYISEIIFYSQKLSAFDRDLVEAYIAAKYGITIP